MFRAYRRKHCAGGRVCNSVRPFPRTGEIAIFANFTNVPDAVFERARAHVNEQEMVALVFTLTTINAWNRLAITMRTEVGNYQPKARPVSQTA